jgi:hypothetical protein
MSDWLLDWTASDIVVVRLVASDAFQYAANYLRGQVRRIERPRYKCLCFRLSCLLIWTFISTTVYDCFYQKVLAHMLIDRNIHSQIVIFPCFWRISYRDMKNQTMKRYQLLGHSADLALLVAMMYEISSSSYAH